MLRQHYSNLIPLFRFIESHTGQQHSVREFCELAFGEVGISLRWEGEGKDEKGVDIKTNRVLIEVDPLYFRPTEVESLLGDATKARKVLGWEPTTTFEELVKEMVRHDSNELEK